MFKSMRWAGRVALGLIGGYALAAPVQAQDSTAYLQGLYDKAKAAGQTEIVVYAASFADNIPLYEAFHARYPTITVKGIDIFGPPLQSRLQAEFASTGPQADLIASGEPDVLNFKAQGWLQAFVPETAKGLPNTLIGPDNMWIDYASIPLGAIVNTTMVAAGQMPKSWKDFTDPAWRAKTSMSNPGGINGLSQALAAGMKAGIIDQAWLDKMAANKPLITPGAVAALQMVATGQAALSPIVAYTQYANAKKQGAPLEFVFPTEGITALPAPFALVAKAPHADAAKLLEAWTMTPEAQAILSTKINQPGTMPGAPPMAGAPPGTNPKVFILDWRYLQDNYPGLLAGFKKTFGT
ncbi:MAG: ABC transporter substrate-binding protein [Nevskiales bacterium]